MLTLLLMLTACDAPSVDEADIDDGIVLLDPRRQLIRLSIDLRGSHPSVADLDAIEADVASGEEGRLTQFGVEKRTKRESSLCVDETGHIPVLHGYHAYDNTAEDQG